MKILFRAALAATLFAGLGAPAFVAHADASPAPAADTILVPRITKGAYGPLMRVKRTSPEARIFFATQKPRSTSPALSESAGTGQKMACRPVALHNNKGAFSVAGGQKLVRCNSDKNAKTTFCAASMPCAQSAPCSMAMTCAL